MTARKYVYFGLEAFTGNAPLKFQGEEPILRRSDDTRWYSGPAAEVAGLAENEFRFVGLIKFQARRGSDALREGHTLEHK